MKQQFIKADEWKIIEDEFAPDRVKSSESIFSSSSIFGFIAIILAAINIFGGFLVTQRMLQMYKKKKDKKK